VIAGFCFPNNSIKVSRGFISFFAIRIFLSQIISTCDCTRNGCKTLSTSAVSCAVSSACIGMMLTALHSHRFRSEHLRAAIALTSTRELDRMHLYRRRFSACCLSARVCKQADSVLSLLRVIATFSAVSIKARG
jgi:hypothetical protein